MKNPAPLIFGLTLILTLLVNCSKPAPTIEVILIDLDNPRGIAVGPAGELFVAEAGTGYAAVDPTLMTGKLTKFTDQNGDGDFDDEGEIERWFSHLATYNAEHFTNSVRDEVGGLTPVELYKVGDAYFVRDGNHRVSVARAQDVPDIEAFVWEYPSLVPLSPGDDLDDLLIKRGYVVFLEKTRLNELRPDQRIELTAPGRYRDILEHIAIHRYFLGQEYDREIAAEEAVTSWYDNVYQPIIRAIRKQGILKQFPGRTEVDLYIWVSRWQHELSERYGKPIGAEEAVDEFAERGSYDFTHRD